MGMVHRRERGAVASGCGPAWARVGLVGLALLLTANPAAALERVVISHSSISGSQAVLWVAKDAGLFERHGLDLQIIFIAGAPRGVQALLGGDVTFALLGGPAPILANLSGSDTVTIMGLVNTLDHTFITREIRRPEDLRGKKLAVARFGSLDDFGARVALRKWGLEPERDVAILQIGEQPARLAALEAGAVHATLIQPPLTVRARKLGFHTLAALADLGLQYQGTCVVTTRGIIRTREATIRAFVRAFVEGAHFYKTQREASTRSIARFMRLTDSEAIQESYERYALKFLQRAPYPTAAGVEVILQDLAAKHPKARGANPQEFIEPRFVRELDETGFIQRLYGR
ncbi:MAG: ABC transporter substrate-binding protein [Deltaproteobacteria bacterium]|nr:ABC transporter substrate-binding protein [Deltaproteobacteria bacterium]